MNAPPRPLDASEPLAPEPTGGVPPDAAAWRDLASADDLGRFAGSYLALQARLVEGAGGAALHLVGTDGLRAVAYRPDAADAAALDAVARLAVADGKGVVDPRADGRGIAIAFPILLDGAPAGAVSLALAGGLGADALRNALRALQWGAAWPRERLLAGRRGDAERKAARYDRALALLAAALAEERFAAAARALATELARTFGCERVALGMVRGRRVRIVAISHSARFGEHMNLVRLLAGAMDEAVDQRATLAHPAEPGEPNVTLAQAALAAAYAAPHVLTLPLFAHDRFVGALTLERAEPLDADSVAVIDAVAAAAAPLLVAKSRADRWLVAVAADAAAAQATRLLGPGHAVRKLVVAGCVAATALFWTWTDTWRVTADATIEGEIQRAIVAPFDGFVAESAARAGDTAAEGALLARLDDRDLALERLRWVTERQQRVLEYERALGERDRAQTRIAQTLIARAEAEIELVDAQLARTRLAAPFAGVVVSGDLSQSVGAAVRRGEVLFELAPLDAYRVVLAIDEGDVAAVTPGQRGALVVASLPGEVFPIVVQAVTPVAEARDGRNAFRVEASVAGDTARLRPGMSGAAKVDVAERRVIWIWTRALRDYLALLLWRWFG